MRQQHLHTRLIAAIASITDLATLGIVLVLSNLDRNLIRGQVEMEAEDHLHEMHNMLEITDNLMMDRVRGAMAVLKDRSLALGAPSQGAEVEVVPGQRVADLMFGDQGQAQRYEWVDGVTALLSGSATLFSRRGEDFVRVATNIKQADGTRAIGTLLDPKGKAAQALRAGSPFYGHVDILGAPYLTAYEPIKDATGQLIGAWYFGFPADFKVIQRTVDELGSHDGFAAIIDDQQRVRFASKGKTPQEVLDIVKGAPGWILRQDSFPEWGYQLYLAQPESIVRDQILMRMIGIIATATLLSLVLIGVIAWMIRRLVSAPLQIAVDLAERVSQGRLDLAVPAQGRDDEVGRLLSAMSNMQEGLRTFFGGLGQAVQRLVDTGHDLARVAEQTRSSMRDQQDQTDQVATAMTEMSAPPMKARCPVPVSTTARSASSRASAAKVAANSRMRSGFSVFSLAS